MKTDQMLALREPIVEKCGGCARTEMMNEKEVCKAYIDPSLKWRLGDCGLATHVVNEADTKKKKINPLKASKRGRR